MKSKLKDLERYLASGSIYYILPTSDALLRDSEERSAQNNTTYLTKLETWNKTPFLQILIIWPESLCPSECTTFRIHPPLISCKSQVLEGWHLLLEPEVRDGPGTVRVGRTAVVQWHLCLAQQATNSMDSRIPSPYWGPCFQYINC